MKAKIEELMTSLDLMDAREKRASNLSGGMKRKLSVAMAIVGKNKVRLYDGDLQFSLISVISAFSRNK